jgi:hypothetical protein
MNDSFMVHPISAGGWDAIAGALARLIIRLRAAGSAHCVIVQVSNEHYVQFMVRGDGSFWAEAVGDCHLWSQPLDDDRRRHLSRLGWNAPDPDGRWAGNYWREWGEAGGELEAAAVAVTTLIEVFGAGAYSEVSVDVFEAVSARP